MSIPAQLKAIRKCCQDKGWKLVAEYIDEGKSAKTADRPAFQKMIAIAKKQNRHFDAIVVHKFDRFSRSREDHVIYKALLKKHGVHVYSVTEQTDSDTPHGFLLEGMLEVISEFYNMNLANETRKGMVENARRGFHNGGSAPYGYRNHRFDQNGVIKSIWVPGPEEELATVKRIYHLYVYEGMGYKKIARLLNEECIPCPSGDKWSYTTIWHILHNEAYIGNRVWNKQNYQTPGKKYKPEDQWIRVTNAHSAFVTQEMFNLVKTRSQQRIRVSSPFVATGTPYILRGLFKCPRCGSNMVSGQGGGRGGYRNIRRYYVCGAYQRKGNTVCHFQAFKKDYIEDLVIDMLIKEFIILSLPGTLEEEVKRQLGEKLKNLRFDLQQAENDISFTLRRIELLKKDIDRVPEPGKLNNYLNELETKLHQLNNKKSSLLDAMEATEIKDTASLSTVVSQLQEFVRNIREVPQETQSHMLRQYINEITYDNITQLLRVGIKIAKPDGETILLTKDSYVKYAKVDK